MTVEPILCLFTALLQNKHSWFPDHICLNDVNPDKHVSLADAELADKDSTEPDTTILWGYRQWAERVVQSIATLEHCFAPISLHIN